MPAGAEDFEGCIGGADLADVCHSRPAMNFSARLVLLDADGAPKRASILLQLGQIVAGETTGLLL